MSKEITSLNPRFLWKYFYELNQIPRGSKNEEAAGKWLVGIAKRFNVPYEQDRAGNVVIRVPATKGHEKAPTVVLQGHIDMVCEKNAGTSHDFTKDPIRMVVDGDWVRAEGTTLGADNGIGVAAGLALLEDESVVHGPLELLCTVDEETGLTGANALSNKFVKGRVLLNLDSEEDGSLYVGCAGGRDTTITFTVNRTRRKKGMKPVGIKVSGLKGGHSGLDIHEGRGNALKIMTRFLRSAKARELDLRLADFTGGHLRNAIAREAVAVVYVPEEKTRSLAAAVRKFEKMLKDELGDLETDLSFKTAKGMVPKVVPAPMTVDEAERLTGMIQILPHGVIGYSRAIHGLVETSTNVAAIKADGNTYTVLTSQRSSSPTQRQHVADQVADGADLCGARAKQGGGYPGWNPNMDSTVLKLLSETHKDMFGKEPKVKAIHAGLECGIIGEKFPGMDMISFGPTIEGAHSPDERVHIGAVKRFYRLLNGVLGKFALQKA